MNDTPLHPAKTAAPENVSRQAIRTWDDPASKVKFMESICQGRDWTSAIYAPPDSGEPGREVLRQLSRELERKGYVCNITRDGPNSLDRLFIHHLGDTSGLIANIHALGFISGGHRTLTHLSGSLGAMMRQGHDLYNYVTADKARLFSSFYLLGDLAYAFSSKGNSPRSEKLEHELVAMADTLLPVGGPAIVARTGEAQVKDAMRQPAVQTIFRATDKLKDLSGWFAVAQSAIYLYYARDTGEVAVGGVQKDLEKALAKGQDPLDEANWRHASHPGGPLGAIDRLGRSHPIEFGAGVQQAGQALLATGGVLRMLNASQHLGHNPALMQHAIHSGMTEVARGVTSVFAWHLLKQNPKNPTEKAAWYDPRRWIQEVESHPQQASAVVNAGASVIGLAGAGHNGNWVQKTAEINYLIGDATMSLMNKSHYGGAESAIDLGAEAAAKLISDSNIVFAWKEEGDFVKRLSGYIGRRIAEETTIESKFPGHEAFLAEVEKRAAQLSPQLGEAITEKLANRGRRFGSICHAAAAIVHQFPAESHPQVIASLAQALSVTKAVYASPDELSRVIAGQAEKLGTVRPLTVTQPTMNELSHGISVLLETLPGYDVGPSVYRVCETLNAHCRPQKMTDPQVPARSLNEMARRKETLPAAHQLQLAETQARAKA